MIFAISKSKKKIYRQVIKEEIPKVNKYIRCSKSL